MKHLPKNSIFFCVDKQATQKNIEFIVEHGSETLPFLDVEVCITEFGIETKIYRKLTRTNLLLNLNAICPINWKSGQIIYLINSYKQNHINRANVL